MSRARLEPQTSQTPGTLTLTLTRPCPPGYVGLLRVICICWMFMLPFTLVDALGWVMIPVVSVTSFLVLCIEQLAVQIENPFGYDANDLPLHSFTCTVEAGPRVHKSAPHPQRHGSPAPGPSRRLPGGAMHSQQGRGAQIFRRGHMVPPLRQRRLTPFASPRPIHSSFTPRRTFSACWRRRPTRTATLLRSGGGSTSRAEPRCACSPRPNDGARFRRCWARGPVPWGMGGGRVQRTSARFAEKPFECAAAHSSA